MATWAQFRKVWIKPEVYPLIGAMGAALGVCGASLWNKAADPTTSWNKAKRKGDVDVNSTFDEVVPLWSSSKHGSTSIFGKDYTVMESKKMHTQPLPPMTIKIGDEEEEEEEAVPEEESAMEEQAVVEVIAAAPAAMTAEPVAAYSAAVTPMSDDDMAAAVHKAIDAAIEHEQADAGTGAGSSKPEPAQV